MARPQHRRHLFIGIKTGRRVNLNKPLRRPDYISLRTIICLKAENLVAREKLLEKTERSKTCAAETIDCLIIIADYCNAAVFTDQKTKYLDLGVVGVLELIDKYIAKPFPHGGSDYPLS